MPTQRVHLPQPVARGHIALRKQGVVDAAGGDPGNALRIPRHRHGRLQTAHPGLPIQLWKGSVGSAAQADYPKEKADRQQQQGIHRPAQHPRTPPGEPGAAALFAPLRSRLRRSFGLGLCCKLRLCCKITLNYRLRLNDGLRRCGGLGAPAACPPGCQSAFRFVCLRLPPRARLRFAPVGGVAVRPGQKTRFAFPTISPHRLDGLLFIIRTAHAQGLF